MTKEELNKILDTRVVDAIPYDRTVTTRLWNALKSNNIITFRDLLRVGPDEVKKFRNFGGKSFRFIEDAMARVGLTWYTNIDEPELSKESTSEKEEWLNKACDFMIRTMINGLHPAVLPLFLDLFRRYMTDNK